MTIQTFSNMRGLIYGKDPRRVECDKDGVLQIGQVKIEITAKDGAIMPNLFHGATGDYDATFTDKDGNVYHLEKLDVRAGWVAPPGQTAMELMDLRCKADSLSALCDQLQAQITELSKIFDTDALNFLIK